MTWNMVKIRFSFFLHVSICPYGKVPVICVQVSIMVDLFIFGDEQCLCIKKWSNKLRLRSIFAAWKDLWDKKKLLREWERDHITQILYLPCWGSSVPPGLCTSCKNLLLQKWDELQMNISILENSDYILVRALIY